MNIDDIYNMTDEEFEARKNDPDCQDALKKAISVMFGEHYE